MKVVYCIRNADGKYFMNSVRGTSHWSEQAFAKVFTDDKIAMETAMRLYTVSDSTGVYRNLPLTIVPFQLVEIINDAT